VKILLSTIAIAVALAGASNLSAQGTAFTYNGRLAVNGNPANGNYDVRFSLYDASVDGDPVGMVTNTFAGLTNGLFITTLDFGNVFTGSNYWIELAARTNGGGDFSILTPRQVITPTPYAMYAAYAGGVAGSGPLSQWSGIGTNDFFGKVTNWVATTVAPTSPGTLAAATSLVASNYPWIQHSPPLAIGTLAQKLGTNGQVRILMIGDSLISRPGSMMYSFISDLKARYGDAGTGFMIYRNTGYLAPFINPAPFSDGTTFGKAMVLKPNDYAFNFQPPPMLYDNVTFYWMGTTNGGDIQVVFSNSTVGFITNVLNGRIAGQYNQIYATNFPGAFTGNNYFFVKGLTGTNVILGPTYINSRAPGIVDFDFATAGSTLLHYLGMATNAMNGPYPLALPTNNALAEIAQTVKPDLIIYCARDATEVASNLWVPAARQLFTVLQANARGLNTPVVIVGIYPEQDIVNSILPPPTNTFESNLLKFQLARENTSNNWYYADLYDYFPSWEQNLKAGLMDDQLHCSSQGGTVFGDLLLKLLGLDSIDAATAASRLAAPATATPVFFASMSEGSGTMTIGRGQAGYPAGLTRLSWTNDPAIGYALIGMNYPSLYFGDVTEVSGLLDMTVLEWIKPFPGNVPDNTLLIWEWQDGGHGAWQLIGHSSPAPGLSLNWYDNLGSFHRFDGPPISGIFDGNWHLFGFDYSATTGTLHLIIDGNEYGTFNAVPPPQVCRNGLGLGSYGGGPALNGEYAGVTIYDRALSSRELSTIYNSWVSRLKAAPDVVNLHSDNGVFTNGITSLKGNLAGPVAITLGKSPFSWTNTSGANVFVFIDGGGGSAIKVNGTTVFKTFIGGHTIPLQPNEYVTLVYSTAPTGLFWKSQ